MDLPANDPQEALHRRSVQTLSFQTPVPMPAAQQCGKVLFPDVHVKQGVGGAGGDDSEPTKPFPSGCRTNASTPQMKALEHLRCSLAQAEHVFLPVGVDAPCAERLPARQDL